MRGVNLSAFKSAYCFSHECFTRLTSKEFARKITPGYHGSHNKNKQQTVNTV